MTLPEPNLMLYLIRLSLSAYCWSPLRGLSHCSHGQQSNDKIFLFELSEEIVDQTNEYWVWERNRHKCDEIALIYGLIVGTQWKVLDIFGSFEEIWLEILTPLVLVRRLVRGGFGWRNGNYPNLILSLFFSAERWVDSFEVRTLLKYRFLLLGTLSKIIIHLSPSLQLLNRNPSSYS